MSALRDGAAIVALGVGSAVVFGVIHNQITVRLSPEFFLFGHPRIFPGDSPATLAICWGIARPLISGLVVMIPAACIAIAGKPPRLSARDLLRPILALCGAMAMASLVGGWAGARSDEARKFADDSPDQRYTIVRYAHRSAHAAGAAGGVAVLAYTALARRRARLRAART